MQNAAKDQPPNTFAWPPVIYVSAAVIGLILDHFWPLPWPTAPVSTAIMMVGVLLVSVAIAMELATVLTFRKHATSILPYRSATNLITSGPFAWSRNPIYLANTLLVVGAGLIFGILWLVIAGVLAAFFTLHLAIKREETHLAAKFGQAWNDYSDRTHRWFGRRKTVT